MGFLLLIMYIIVFVFILVKYVRCILNKGRWGVLLGIELLAIITSLGLAYYFDGVVLKLDAFDYFGEWLFSFSAIIAYGGLFILSILTIVIKTIIGEIKNPPKK